MTQEAVQECFHSKNSHRQIIWGTINVLIRFRK